jgi:hypothetical protein
MPLVTSQMLSSPWPLVAAGLCVVGLVALVAGLIALVRQRPLTFLLRLAVGALLLAGGALVGTVAVGTVGYRALTQEVTAASVHVQPDGPQHFNATVRFPDGSTQTFAIAGDEIYIDAHILKWKAIANLVGLHTAYELDRIAGRYHSVADERASPRTVYPLGVDKPLDLFNLRKRYVFLEPLLDAEYGSASFVPVARPAELEVRISASGVLIRERAR